SAGEPRNGPIPVTRSKPAGSYRTNPILAARSEPAGARGTKPSWPPQSTRWGRAERNHARPANPPHGGARNEPTPLLRDTAIPKKSNDPIQSQKSAENWDATSGFPDRAYGHDGHVSPFGSIPCGNSKIHRVLALYRVVEKKNRVLHDCVNRAARF